MPGGAHNALRPSLGVRYWPVRISGVRTEGVERDATPGWQKSTYRNRVLWGTLCTLDHSGNAAALRYNLGLAKYELHEYAEALTLLTKGTARALARSLGPSGLFVCLLVCLLALAAPPRPPASVHPRRTRRTASRRINEIHPAPGASQRWTSARPAARRPSGC